MSGAVSSDFRRRVRAGEPLVGSFASLGSAVTAEIMAVAGFDWLVIDLEHGAGDEQAAHAQIMAVERSGVTPLVRVESIDATRFHRVLDLGAAGIVAPRLESADDARRCAEFCRYHGGRGVAKHNRSWHWSLARRTLAEVDDEVVCAVQIETAAALDDVDAIAAVDGVDILFVGPGDLAHSLGMTCGPDDPALERRIAEVADAAARHGKVAGIFVGSPELAARYHRLGFSFLGSQSDGSLLAARARTLSDDLRAVVTPV